MRTFIAGSIEYITDMESEPPYLLIFEFNKRIDKVVRKHVFCDALCSTNGVRACVRARACVCVCVWPAASYWNAS